MQVLHGLYKVIISSDKDKRFAIVGEKQTPVLNLKVVPYFPGKQDDDIGTEWIQVTIWGKPAEWYQPIEHNTLVYIRGMKVIKLSSSGEQQYSNPSVSIGSNMFDTFIPLQLLRYDVSESSSSSSGTPTPDKSILDDEDEDIPF